jgi:hypothetical protein
MTFTPKLLQQGASGASGYQISRSLRFNSPDSAYLNRTPSSITNRQTWTWSSWVKRGALGATSTIFGYCSNDALQQQGAWFKSDNTLQFYIYSSGYNLNLITTQVFRDVSAWYHIVIAQDTTQATDTNRVKIYVNGVQITSFSTAGYPSQNLNGYINSTVAHGIGSFPPALGSYFDGYQTECYLIDGQALTPSSFGATNTNTGVWGPKAYTGTYGTNGFYLKFSDNSNTTAATLGKDYSGNGNNWTPNNFSVTAGSGNDSLVDIPTPYGTDNGVGGTVRGNYCTWNPLQNSGLTLSDGNLTTSYSTAAWVGAVGTIAMNSGKWYFEFTNIGPYSDYQQFGVMKTGEVPPSGTQPTNGTAYGWTYSIDGYLGHNNSYTNTGITGYNTVGDVAMVAVDVSSGKIWFGKNGTWFNSGSPSTGANAAYTDVSSSVIPTIYQYAASHTNSGSTNFGQRPFAYTAPSGFKALCTQNLPTPTIGATSATLASQFFDTSIWTGNGDNVNPRAITSNVDMANGGGLIWTKGRDLAVSHFLVDSVRVYTKYFATNSTAAEDTYNFGVAGTTNGFTFTTSSGSLNQSPYTYVGWQWKAGGTAVTNTTGSITSSVSANPTSGFSIVTWTGTGTGSTTVGHGLSTLPQFVIIKKRNTTSDWYVASYASGQGLNYAYHLFLNTTGTLDSNNDPYYLGGQASLTSNVLAIAPGTSNTGGNENGTTYVAYCWTPVEGYSAFGSYTGNGSASGPFVYTGFRPKYLLIKRTDVANDWVIQDTSRSAYNTSQNNLYAESSGAEASYAAELTNILSNGFQQVGTGVSMNASSGTYIYMAFAESPFKYALAR